MPRSKCDCPPSAQNSPPADDLSAHRGVAVTPVGTSLGQDGGWVVVLHCGEQKSPAKPWTWTFVSSAPQPAAVFGSS